MKNCPKVSCALPLQKGRRQKPGSGSVKITGNISTVLHHISWPNLVALQGPHAQHKFKKFIHIYSIFFLKAISVILEVLISKDKIMMICIIIILLFINYTEKLCNGRNMFKDLKKKLDFNKKPHIKSNTQNTL